MPLGRADIGHRLHNTIFGLKIRGQRRCEVSDFAKTRKQTFRA
jgi:hypothetical protein